MGASHEVSHEVGYAVGHEVGHGAVMGSVMRSLMESVISLVRRLAMWSSHCQKLLFVSQNSKLVPLTHRCRGKAAKVFFCL